MHLGHLGHLGRGKYFVAPLQKNGFCVVRSSRDLRWPKQARTSQPAKTLGGLQLNAWHSSGREALELTHEYSPPSLCTLPR